MTAASIHLQSGPYVVRIATDLPALRQHLADLYPQRAFIPATPFADFQVEITRPANLRRWWRPQAMFRLDRMEPFRPLPLAQAPALFEWGLNACLAARAHDHLIIHAGSIECRGLAAIFPGVPGAGKSTLTAGLVWRGWRLLTDEMTMVSFDTGQLAALARPVNLKGNSIDIIRGYAPEARFGEEMPDTIKGRIALMRPPEDSSERVAEPATPRWVIFPRWERGAMPRFKPMSKSMAFVDLGRNSMNYSVHGRRGFEAMAALIDRCDCFRFTYGSLDDAVDAFSDLWAAA